MTPQLYHIIGYCLGALGLLAYVYWAVKWAGWRVTIQVVLSVVGVIAFISLVIWLITR